MHCCYTRKKVKEDVVNGVNEDVTNYAKASDDHLMVTRTFINQLLQLLQKTHCDDEEGSNDQCYENIEELRSLYEKKGKELIVKKRAALGSLCTLLEALPIKKKRELKYSRIERRLLEEYLGESAPDLPALCIVKLTEGKPRGKKIWHHLEQNLEQYKNNNIELNRKVDELAAENKRLKTTSLSQVAEINVSPVKSKFDEHETQELKISNEKEVIREVHQQDSARHKRNASYSKMSEYAVKNVEQNNGNDNKVHERARSDVAFQGTNEDVNSCHEDECIKREEYNKLKEVICKLEKEIEGSKLDIRRINNEKKKLEDDITAFKQKIAKANEEHKDLNAHIYQHKQEASNLKSQLESKIMENEELHDKNIQIIKEKATIEKTKKEISCNLGAKINEENQLKNRLDEEARISRKLKEEQDTFKQEIDSLQKLLNMKDKEIVKQKAASDDCILKMQQDNDDKSTAYRKTQNDASERITDLQEDVKKKAAHISQLELQIEGHLKKITNLETEIRHEKKHNEELESNLKKAEEKNKLKVEKLRREIEDLLQDKNVQTENLKDMKKNVEELQATLLSQKETSDAKELNLTQENKVLMEKLAETEKNIKGLQATFKSQKETFDADVSDLTKEKNILTENLTDLKNEVQDLHIALSSQKEKFDAKVSDLTQNLKHIQARNSEIEKTLTSLQHDNLELHQMYETAKEELDQFKSIKTIQIQLYHNSRVPLISKVENELKSMLKRELESSATKLEFIDCEKVTDVEENKPLLILCICASRLGTDAANAIQSLKLASNMALLVIHHKDGHALPNQASEHVLTGNEYKRLGGIFDFGFLLEKGIYSSELNERNFRNILHFLNKAVARCVRK